MQDMVLNNNTSAARVLSTKRPCRIMVANGKGGCGKTTLATNLAAYLAQEQNVVLLDYDPQGSSMDWLELRDSSLPSIQGIAAFDVQKGSNKTKSWSLRVPVDTDTIVIDTPAGLSGFDLDDLVRHADVIVIPVTASFIDIRAATRFIKDILLSYSFRRRNVPVAIVANRVRRNTLVYQKLKTFLNSLSIPFVASIHDAQLYVRASESGQSVFDLTHENMRDKGQWQALTNWIRDQRKHAEQTCNVS